MTYKSRESFRLPLSFVANAISDISNRRLKIFGVLLLVGHPVFWLLWSHLFPQPYENRAVRLVLAATGLYLIFRNVDHEPESLSEKSILTFVVWLNIPVFFAWMYVRNEGNVVWLGSLCAAIFTAYGVFVRNQANFAVLIGLLVGFGLGVKTGNDPIGLSAQDMAVHTILVCFCWTIAAAISSTTILALEKQKRASLETLGIVAHELRSPIATMSLLTDAIEAAATDASDEHAMRASMLNTVKTMRGLTSKINRLIDTQISNARQDGLPPGRDTLIASGSVLDAISAYPFNTTRERESVEVTIEQDFEFIGSTTQFNQVLDNLIKNSLYSLRSKDEPFRKGDLKFHIGVVGNMGEITVSDRGTGIPEAIRNQIFDSFFSTNADAGHGLGLALCRSVMKSMEGGIRLNPADLVGASFTLQIPIKQQIQRKQI